MTPSPLDELSNALDTYREIDHVEVITTESSGSVFFDSNDAKITARIGALVADGWRIFDIVVRQSVTGAPSVGTATHLRTIVVWLKKTKRYQKDDAA